MQTLQSGYRGLRVLVGCHIDNLLWPMAVGASLFTAGAISAAFLPGAL